MVFMMEMSHGASQLAVRQIKRKALLYHDFLLANKVFQHIPATHPALQHTWFFASPDFSTWTTHHVLTILAQLLGLYNIDSFILTCKSQYFQ